MTAKNGVSRVDGPSVFLSVGVDLLCLVFIAIVLVLTLVFAADIPDWKSHCAGYVVAAVAYTAAVAAGNRFSHEFLRVCIHTAAVTLLFSYLFGAVHSLQHIVVPGWMDAQVLAFETAFTGRDATLYFQDHMSPTVTEVMMFAYISYVPLLPLISLICFWSADHRAAQDYLFSLSYSYILCYIGFMLYPVASPLYHQRELYSIPFEGGVFTWFGEWMRHNVHFAGGSLPSPHCAASTVMLGMMWRYNRRLFRPLFPLVILIYVSTVYGRYHYVSDGVAGIVAGAIVLATSSKLSAFLEGMWRREPATGAA
ncbi:MAG: phosphatase PAP2 family protein [Candidatus Kapaibacterium sp.]